MQWTQPWWATHDEFFWKVGFIMVNFWKKLVEKANFYWKNYWNILVSAKIMVQSKFRANYRPWTVQLINIFWKIKGCSEKKITEENYWGHMTPGFLVPTALKNINFSWQYFIFIIVHTIQNSVKRSKFTKVRLITAHSGILTFSERQKASFGV